MKKRNRMAFVSLLLFSFCLAITGRSGAQEIVSLGASLDTPLETPLKFHKAENVCRSEIPRSEKVGGTIWEVFPLRNNLPLYDGPNESVDIGKAQIGEHYVAYADRGDYLLLGSGPTWGERFEGMAFKGWAKKSDLLTHRMALKKSGIWRKAMVVNFIPSVEHIELKVEDFRIAPFFSNPECQGEPLGNIQVLRFLFVYETFPSCSDKPTSVLVAEKPVLTGEKDLLGWIPINRITLWDTREALELNFDAVAQANREAKNLPANVFQNLQSAYNYAGPKNKHNAKTLKKRRISAENFSEKYWPPEILRYPILRRIDMKNLKTDERDDIYEIGFIGNTIKLGAEDEKYKGEISRGEAAGQQQALELTFQSFTKLDMLFVVDATSSMGPYLKAVADAIENAMQSISSSYSADWDIRFAGAIYRDYEDERSNGLFDHRDLTPDQNSVAEFYRKVKDRSADTDYPEALFYGLKNAISATHFRAQSMRYVVLISDAGNHDPDKRGMGPERVGQSLYDNQCHFLCIRVAPDSPSGRDAGPQLKQQIREWILGNASRAQDDIQLRLADTQSEFSKYLSTPQLRDMGDLMLMVGAHVLGAYVIAENSAETQAFIEKYLARAVDTHDSFRDVTRLLATGASLGEAVEVLRANEKSSDTGGDLSASLETANLPTDGGDDSGGMAYDQVWLRHIISRIPNAQDLLERRVTIYQRAFVNMFCEDLREPLFRPVILITASGLSSLINLIEDLIGNADTERLSETWRRVLDAVSGEEGVHKSVADYARQRISLPVNSELLKMPLREIDELSTVMIRELVAGINEKKNDLEKILYDDSPTRKRWFLMSEIKYYWVRVNELP